MDVGTIGTRNMLELAREKKVKSFLFTSSSEVYGDPDDKHVPTAEEYRGNVSVTGPRACYDESKRFGETMCETFWNVYGVPVKMVRPFNVYGPGIRPDDYRVLPNFIEHRSTATAAIRALSATLVTRSRCFSVSFFRRPTGNRSISGIPR
jgi:nucleoside-diphosphate-sugar epimerase